MGNTELRNHSGQSGGTYNRRWLIGVTAGPLAVGLAAAAWMATVAGSLPDQLASHWGPDGVDGYSSLWGMAAVAVFASGGTGAVVAGLSVLTRGYSALLARIGVGFGIGLGVLMTGLAAAVVAGQIGLTDASQAEIHAPLVWTASAAGCAAGGLCGWLYRPAETDRTPSPETAAVDSAAASQDSSLAAGASLAAANGESLTIRISMGPAQWLVSLGTGAVVALSLVFIHPALALLGIAVFRIVQECLTNALKHGGRGTAVRIHFDWSGPGLTVHAASDPARHQRPPEDTAERGTGRGIPGMRERAHLAGGWLTAGPDGEQFRVTLFLPYGTADNRPAAGAVLEDPDSGEPGSGHTTGLALDSGAREERQDA